MLASNAEPIMTRRLIMRPLRLTDAPAIARLCNDASLSQWLAVVPFPYSAFEARKFLTHALRVKLDGKAPGVRIICLRSNPGITVGMIEITARKRGHVLGYWMGRAYRRRGYVSEAARAMVASAFENGVESMIADYKVGNAPSARVIRNLGFQRTRVLYGPSRYLGRKTLTVRSLLTREIWMARAKGLRLPPA